MSYTGGGQYEVLVAPCADLATINTDVGFFSPGYLPVRIRAVVVGPTTALANAAGAVRIDKRVTAGSDTGRLNGDVTTINIPNALAAGKIVYKHGLNYAVSPGNEIVARVTATAGNVKANVTLMVEPSFELPANNTGMQATT